MDDELKERIAYKFWALREMNLDLRDGMVELEDKNQSLKEDLSKLEDKNESLKKDLTNLEYKNNSLQANVRELLKNNNQLQQVVQDNQNTINYLSIQSNYLNQKIKKEEKRKSIEQRKLSNFKTTFEKDKIDIEKKNLQNSKNYITNFIINNFVKEFEEKKDNISKFTKTLTQYMNKFTKEFMTYNQIFIQTFKVNSQEIIKNYNVNHISFSIEHINFIVIGKAGTGKSTFINESLLLPQNKRAKVGDGLSVTEKSNLYCSEKLGMIRMWDTQGIDYKISQDYILNEVKRIVNEGLEKGPDYYINIILYCTSGNRFQEEDGKMIYEIMKLYPMDNLPVIITQLQSYFKEDAEKMELIIRKILAKYLENQIVEKIEIKSVVAKDKKVEEKIFRAKGIPELFRCSFDLMSRAITSATFKKFSQDIENICKKFVDVKIDFIHKIFKNEMEILEIAKDKFADNSEKYFKNEDKIYKKLSKDNIYNKIEDKNYFINNFTQIMSYKFIDIFNNLNNLNESCQSKNKPLVLIFIQDRLERLKKILNDCSENVFGEIYKQLFQEFLSELHLKQSSRKKEFETNYDIIDSSEINENFKYQLFGYFKNEFFKYFFCIILKLFMNDLKNILIDNYEKELKENEEMKKIINLKAENSLKYVTRNLKEKLLNELDKYFREPIKERVNQIKKSINIDFEFPEY